VSLLVDTRGEQVRENTKKLTVVGTFYLLESDEELDSVKAVFKRQHPRLYDRRLGAYLAGPLFQRFQAISLKGITNHEPGHNFNCSSTTATTEVMQ
jgi:hypothetical protein